MIKENYTTNKIRRFCIYLTGECLKDINRQEFGHGSHKGRQKGKYLSINLKLVIAQNRGNQNFLQ